MTRLGVRNTREGAIPVDTTEGSDYFQPVTVAIQIAGKRPSRITPIFRAFMARSPNDRAVRLLATEC